jgi:outer membrane protein OmpA-like peptidoglycan-associated protein
MAYNRLFIFSLLLLLVINGKNLIGQNLILNGNLELYNKQNRYFPLRHIKYWNNPTLASTDYQSKKYHWKHISNINAFSGNIYLGLSLIGRKDYSEYATCKIKEKLIKDSLYCLTLYVAVLKSNWIGQKELYFPELDVLFSNKRIKEFSKKPLYPKYKASIKNIGNYPISNVGFWEKRSAVYIAKGGENFITFGVLSNSDTYRNITEYDGKFSSYIAIDKLNLIQISDSSNCSCNNKRRNFSILEKSDSIGVKSAIIKKGLILRFNKLNFNTGNYQLDTSSIEELDQLYTILEGDTSLKIIINGHTDSEGNAKSNQRLSEKRAKSVVEYLIDKGIAQDRISYKGYGSSYPISTNETKEGRAKNRRVEVEFK